MKPTGEHPATLRTLAALPATAAELVAAGLYRHLRAAQRALGTLEARGLVRRERAKRARRGRGGHRLLRATATMLAARTLDVARANGEMHEAGR